VAEGMATIELHLLQGKVKVYLVLSTVLIMLMILGVFIICIDNLGKLHCLGMVGMLDLVI
jgi:hypothetical protein